jgi:hypothetical protein
MEEKLPYFAVGKRVNFDASLRFDANIIEIEPPLA